jgi:hypothetical protein
MNDSKRNAWLINGLLAVILTLLVGFYLNTGSSTAYAAGGGWETNGIMAITASQNEQLILLNTDPNDKTSGQNIMIYRAEGANGKFRLLGARSFKYDVELVDTSASLQTEQKYQQGATFVDVYKDWQDKNK